MSKGALIIGGSVAGTQAALDLASSGIDVDLVESAPFLGNGGATTIPGHLFNSRLLEVAKHPNITVWTNAQVHHARGEGGRLHVELRQHPRYVDLSKCTACGDCIEVCPVTVPGSDRKAIFLSANGQPACAAIEKLGKAPCSNTCPGGIHVQGYVALIAEGRFQEAIDLIREAIPFPGICGRICTHPCELNCRRAEVDQAVAIRALKRFVSDWELGAGLGQEPAESVERVEHAAPDGQRTQSSARTQSPARVAIVGAGPGGMAVADRLARLGYGVTVFEKLPVIGGMMALGIPEYRLPREVIAREYAKIQALGVDIRLNTSIGAGGDHTLDDLFEMGYEAVCLAIGAHQSHELRIPGEDLQGVFHGLELLEMISLSQQMDDATYKEGVKNLLPRGTETRVAVLGGGNTAMDVSRSLRRLGVKDVRILYRRTRHEMPATPEEAEDAEQEGITIEFLVSPVRVLGDDQNGVTGLECLRMKLGEADASGRRRPVPIAGSEFVVGVDLVVLAIGQAPDLEFLGGDHGIAITRDGRINVDGVSFMTSRPGVFAAGDAVTRDKMAVIEAIGMGKQAAAEIDAYLKGELPREIVVDARQVPIARREMGEEELATKPRVAPPTIPMERRLRSYDEVELGYSAQQAMAEAQRCLVCGPCSECLACVRACKPGAVIHEQHEIFVELETGAVIDAGGDQGSANLPLVEGVGFYRALPDSPLAGSAAAARAMFDLLTARQVKTSVIGPAAKEGEARIGVFVCQCGDYIARVVDTDTLRERAVTWPDVVHAQVLPFSCSLEAAETIDEAILVHDLSRVVLAACSCCAIDQVCYSCTYQRVRCKDNLGIFDMGVRGHQPRAAHPRVTFEFVNIREQCAWVHASDPMAATAKATALVAAAVAKMRVVSPGRVVEPPPEQSALILGSGAAARTCRSMLGSQGIAARQIEGLSPRIWRAGGRYVVTENGSRWEASALVLAAGDAAGAQRLLAGLHHGSHQAEPKTVWGGLDTHRPGVFYCDPGLDAETVGAAAAARVAAWLGQPAGGPGSISALVEPARCRACNTCVEVCEFGAPQLVGEEPERSSWIDPLICTGCGTCAAHCPSGAITAGYSTDMQLELMLDAVLA